MWAIIINLKKVQLNSIMQKNALIVVLNDVSSIENPSHKYFMEYDMLQVGISMSGGCQESIDEYG